MNNLTIILATDHRGFTLKEEIKAQFSMQDTVITWQDVGAFDNVRTDYPVYAHAAIQKKHELQRQDNNEIKVIMLCGTGTGMAIAANRYSQVYAAVVWDVESARKSKQDDNINVLVLPADFITKAIAFMLIEVWLKTPFKGGRYEKRLDLIDSFCLP